MKTLRLLFVLVPTFIFLAHAQDVLTNESILKLVKSGLGENLIVTMVQSQPGKYLMTPDEVLKLKEAGVSEKILTAMATKGAGPAAGPAGSVKLELKTPVRLSVDGGMSTQGKIHGKTLIDDEGESWVRR